MRTCVSRRWRCPDQRRAARRLQGEAKIPTVQGNINGLKANHLLRLEHLYRRRVPVDTVITPELARACTELSHEIRRQIGLAITRRGAIEQALVGSGRELVLPDLSRSRLGRRLLPGVSLLPT